MQTNSSRAAAPLRSQPARGCQPARQQRGALPQGEVDGQGGDAGHHHQHADNAAPVIDQPPFDSSPELRPQRLRLRACDCDGVRDRAGALDRDWSQVRFLPWSRTGGRAGFGLGIRFLAARPMPSPASYSWRARRAWRRSCRRLRHHNTTGESGNGSRRERSAAIEGAVPVSLGWLAVSQAGVGPPGTPQRCPPPGAEGSAMAAASRPV